MNLVRAPMDVHGTEFIGPKLDCLIWFDEWGNININV